MTQQEFDTLPGLLTRQQFLAVTGLSKDKLRAEVDAGLVTLWRPSRPTAIERARSYSRYYKHEAAHIGGFVMK